MNEVSTGRRGGRSGRVCATAPPSRFGVGRPGCGIAAQLFRQGCKRQTAWIVARLFFQSGFRLGQNPCSPRSRIPDMFATSATIPYRVDVSELQTDCAALPGHKPEHRTVGGQGGQVRWSLDQFGQDPVLSGRKSRGATVIARRLASTSAKSLISHRLVSSVFLHPRIVPKIRETLYPMPSAWRGHG